MIQYYLAIDKKKINIFKLDDAKPSFPKKYERLKQKYKYLRNIIVDDETKEIIGRTKQININDIKYLLDQIVETLASGDNFENVKYDYLEDYKYNKKMNPIFVILMRAGTDVIDILSMLEFPRKSITLEILKSNKDNKAKYLDIKRIDEINFMEQEMTRKIKSVVSFGIMMFLASVGIGAGFKYKMAPKIAEFLHTIQQGLGMTNMQQETPLITIVANWFFYIIMFVISLVVLLFIIKYVAKNIYNYIIYKVPYVSNILKLQNDIYILMLYSFYRDNPPRLAKQLREHFNFVKGFNWDNSKDIGDLIEKLYLYIHQNYYIEVFDIELKSSIKKYDKDPRADEKIKQKMDRYFIFLSTVVENLQKKLTTVITTIIGVIVGALFLSLILTLKEIPEQIQKMKDASGM